MEALEALNSLSGETMTLFVVDGESLLAGSLTDGDIRRALLAGHSLQTPVREICRTDCLSICSEDKRMDVIAEARRRDIYLLPVVEGGRIVSLLDLRIQLGIVPVDGVLMAGGAGERLRPLTENTPKPLLKVGERPIIDHNIALMRAFGIDNIFVTVNYLKEQMKAHLDGVSVVEEQVKSGTIGSLSLIEGFRHSDVLVMNADLLTDINLESMYLKHTASRACMTVAVVPYSVSVPFAIMEHEADRITGLTEKPTYNYYANAGIYIITREAIADIPRGAYMDATDLIELQIRKGRRVSLFPIEGKWIDIGSPDDYRRACETYALKSL